MVKRLYINEANKGYSSKVYDALQADFADSDGKVDPVYLSDQVELWLMNTRKLYDQMFNNRRKSYSVAYEAMLDLFQDIADRYDTGVRVTSEMAKRWLSKNGMDYKEVLKPVIARVEEEKEERRNESVSRRPRSMREARSERKTYTQKQLRDMIRSGKAIDVTNYSFDDANELWERGYKVVGVSRGMYGLNGALLKMNDTGELCAITARNSTLSQLV